MNTFILIIVLSTWNHENIVVIRESFTSIERCTEADKTLTNNERMYIHINMHGCFKQ